MRTQLTSHFRSACGHWLVRLMDLMDDCVKVWGTANVFKKKIKEFRRYTILPVTLRVLLNLWCNCACHDAHPPLHHIAGVRSFPANYYQTGIKAAPKLPHCRTDHTQSMPTHLRCLVNELATASHYKTIT